VAESCLCARFRGATLSPSLKVLLAWRLIQGCSADGGVIVGRAIIGDIAAGPIAHRMIAHVMIVVAAAPAVAPIAGGYLCGFDRGPSSGRSQFLPV